MNNTFDHPKGMKSQPSAFKGAMTIGETALLGIALIRPSINSFNQRLYYGWAFHEYEGGYADQDDEGEYFAHQYKVKPLMVFTEFDSYKDVKADIDKKMSLMT